MDKPITQPGDPYFTVRCFICDDLITLADAVCELTDVEDGRKHLAHADCAETHEVSIH